MVIGEDREHVDSGEDLAILEELGVLDEAPSAAVGELTADGGIWADARADHDRCGGGDAIDRVFSQLDLDSECSELGSTSMS